MLSGGSAYGLDARQGVVRYLEERNIGWKVRAGVVPIVPAAILMDLGFGGSPKVRPTADCGYKAAEAATAGPVAEGNVGAGAGATVGKMGGRPMKGGVGSAAITLPNGLVVAAIVAINASETSSIRRQDRSSPACAPTTASRSPTCESCCGSGDVGRRAEPRAGENTTIGLVATNARLSKTEINRVALMADDGFARAINPSHTTGDGDTVFALATGRWEGEASPAIIGALAAEAMAEAIVRAVSRAETLGGVPSARELGTVPARLK